MTLRKKEDTRN